MQSGIAPGHVFDMTRAGLVWRLRATQRFNTGQPKGWLV
jgi:hypothetical protein